MEIWKEIKDYPNYMVSNLGRVKSLNYNRTGVEQLRKLTFTFDEFSKSVITSLIESEPTEISSG